MDGSRLPVIFPFFRAYFARIHHALTAELSIVRIQDFPVFSFIGHPDDKLLAHIGKIGNCHQSFLFFLGFPHKCQHAVIGTDTVNPLKTVPGRIKPVHGRLGCIQMIQRLYQLLHPFMAVKLHQSPFHFPCLVPLIKFRDILSHEQQLPAGMQHHVSIGQTQIGKFILNLARHFPNQCSLPVDYFVMGEHKHEILAVSIYHAECQFIMVMGTEIGVKSNIAQIVIHPSHIPFYVKAKPVILHISRNFRPCGGFLGNHQHTRIPSLHYGIQMFQQFHRFQILMAAVHIGHPLPVALPVIQVKHGSHRIHPDSVRMILLNPIKGIGNQVIGNLRPAVIINQCPPMRMRAFPRILMFIETGSVKVGKPIGIPWEMRRHPVQNDADAGFMHFIHKIFEILVRPVPGSRRIIPNDLISPGAVKRMLHHRHQFDMRVTHLFHIIGYQGGEFPVIQITAVLCLLKGTEIQFVNADGPVFSLPFLSACYPLVVFPFYLLAVCRFPDNGGRIRPQLLPERIRICL